MIKDLLSEIVAISEVEVERTDFFMKRGFSTEIIKEYRLGYLPNGLENFATLLNEEKIFLSCYKYVIPNIKDNGEIDYVIFRVDKKTMQNLLPFELDSSYALGNFIGKIWNDKALFSNDGKIFVTETWTDALSVIQCGGAAIALNRVTNVADLWKKILLQNMSTVTFIAACDTDYYGVKTNKNLVNMLNALNYRCRCFDNFPDKIKDCNDWFQIDEDSFCREVTRFANL